jgi:hypothetical protein
MVDAELGEGAGERQPDGTGTHDQYIGTGRQGWHAVLLGWELVGLLDHDFPHRELTLSREQAGRVIEPSLSDRHGNDHLDDRDGTSGSSFTPTFVLV